MKTVKHSFEKFMEITSFGNTGDETRAKIKRVFYSGAFTVCRSLIDCKDANSALLQLEQFVDELSEYHNAGMPLDDDERIKTQ